MDRSQIVKSICRTLFIKEKDVIVDLFFNGLFGSQMKVHKQFSLCRADTGTAIY